MNVMMVIAVYAAISKELGLPLRFPSAPGANHSVYQATDSNLLVRAMTFCATEPAAANSVFNVKNGDFFRWVNAWPKIAYAFDMDWAPPQTIALTEFVAEKAPLWEETRAATSSRTPTKTSQPDRSVTMSLALTGT